MDAKPREMWVEFSHRAVAVALLVVILEDPALSETELGDLPSPAVAL